MILAIWHVMLAAAVAALCLFFDSLLARLRIRKQLPSPVSTIVSRSAPKYNENHRDQVSPAVKAIEVCSRLNEYKNLYYKLHNVESHPDILPQCKDLLLSMLCKAVQRAENHKVSGLSPSILVVQPYSPDHLSRFIRSNNQHTLDQWKEYLQGRRNGKPRALLPDRQAALQWLKAISPVRLVDGAWLGHINKVATPYSWRNATKYAWQIYSEELGDGDVAKNHVAVFTELLRGAGIAMPRPGNTDFIHNPDAPESVEIWESGVAQLLISLFPNDFLPEILGFNLQFELITLETLQASKEIEEMGMDPCYFRLHITIDNIHSGHGAIAMKAVQSYLEAVQTFQGEEAMEQAWRRVQAGYLLSESLPTSPKTGKTLVPTSRSEIEKKLLSILVAKAEVSSSLHDSSKCRFGGRSLAAWLDHDSLASEPGQLEFLRALSEAKPWVKKGNKEGSRLYQGLGWEGKMFGAFSRSEASLVGMWIDALGDFDEEAYWKFVTGGAGSGALLLPELQIATGSLTTLPAIQLDIAKPDSPTDFLPTPLTLKKSPVLAKLLPLWLTHTCLLEGFISIPSRASTVTGCAITRILRAQAGFLPEGPIVDGMDEVSQPNSSFGLVEIGIEIADKHMHFSPATLSEVLTKYPSTAAEDMLALSNRPVENVGVLMGMAWAFAEMHEIVGNMDLFSVRAKGALESIAQREKAGLQVCIEQNKEKSDMVSAGYAAAKGWIEDCFE
ncbi:hypothetical protein BLS_005050 [Venturia inaequalis]|uniref:Uncharacterized protein n=1 Tax=Venturia inaequalis TaxID=5025 RepID=A0A8H3VJF6_VENIN|nr:hypothetical protein BLS_005050 [Venturia inaequalis]KAE9988151.1 hypothetical protein EG327_003473 [Venturia inaequalis]KAE9988866.1 hypothetical protein EG328_005576 [Venturia inaequalis]